MARPLRLEAEGAVYHVIARGNERKAVFRDDRDRQEYLDRLIRCRGAVWTAGSGVLPDGWEDEVSRAVPVLLVLLNSVWKILEPDRGKEWGQS
jgi:hypothetical protein